MSCGIHMKTISQEMLKISIIDMNLKTTDLTLQPHVPGVKELRDINCFGVFPNVTFGAAWWINCYSEKFKVFSDQTVSFLAQGFLHL